MWRSLFGGCLAAVAGALLITACSSDSRAPTEPAPPPVSASIVPTGCPTVGATANMIIALYPAKGGARLLATVTYAAVLFYINTKHQADARTLVFRLLDYTFQQFNAGKLIGVGPLATPQQVLAARQQLLAFEMGLYCTVGLPTTGLTLPGDPSDPGTVNKVVFPSGNPQTVVTGDGNAGVLLPSGSFNTPAVVVTISRIPDPPPHTPPPLNTTLDQYGPFYDVKVSPESGITSDLTVGLCLPTGGDIPTVFLAHNVGQGIQVLPPGGMVTGLGCTQTGSIGAHAMFDLAMRGEIGRAANALGSAVADLLLPTNAYAGSGGKTGTTKSFSPFGGVDTKVNMTTNPASFPAQSAPAGSAVANPPSVIVKTQGGTVVGKVNVLFSVTGGHGTVAGGSSATVATDANGIATVGNWVINTGANSVLAVGTFADPTVTFAAAPPLSGFPQNVEVDPTAGVSFTATGGDVVPYGSSYLFLDGPQGHDPGFEASSPTGWLTGNAPFGTVDEGGTCPLNSVGGLNSGWAVGTDLLLLKTFPLPTGWAMPLTINAAIDNDIQVFVNGHLLSPNLPFTGPDAGNYKFDDTTLGFVTHENCATKGSLTFTVPAALLHGGQDTLAIRARDRRGLDYVDVNVTAPTP